jgi:hypothetical protein
MRFYLKVPGLGQKKKRQLNLLNFGGHLLQNRLLGLYTVIPSFLPCLKSTIEVIFHNAVEYHLQFPLDVGHCSKTSSLQFYFQFGKKAESQWAKSSK